LESAAGIVALEQGWQDLGKNGPLSVSPTHTPFCHPPSHLSISANPSPLLYRLNATAITGEAQVKPAELQQKKVIEEGIILLCEGGKSDWGICYELRDWG
jgi:hypothetical protein